MENIDKENRIDELESGIHEVLDQIGDDLCFMDAYKILGKLVYREFDPTRIPRRFFEENCKAYADFLYEGIPYKPCKLTEIIKEHAEAKDILINESGFDSGMKLTDMIRFLMKFKL
jgi:hypothetical protein